jgi:hypothetical protein
LFLSWFPGGVSKENVNINLSYRLQQHPPTAKPILLNDKYVSNPREVNKTLPY